MTIAHEILIAAIVSLLAFSASILILLGDSAAAPPYADGTCPDIARTAPQPAFSVCVNPANPTAHA